MLKLCFRLVQFPGMCKRSHQEQNAEDDCARYGWDVAPEIIVAFERDKFRHVESRSISENVYSYLVAMVSCVMSFLSSGNNNRRNQSKLNNIRTQLSSRLSGINILCSWPLKSTQAVNGRARNPPKSYTRIRIRSLAPQTDGGLRTKDRPLPTTFMKPTIDTSRNFRA